MTQNPTLQYLKTSTRVHNNFYFLRQISRQLDAKLTGSVVSECFSQSKDELMIRFEIGSDSFLIRASLLPSFSLLSFPENYQRARKNSVDLFGELIGRRVTGVRQFENERSFSVRLSGDVDILFKMHGNRTNVIVFQQQTANNLFRKNIQADLQLDLNQLDRSIDWSFESFSAHSENIKGLYFTFGKLVWQYLEEQGFHQQSLGQRWDLLQSVLQKLNDPRYYITLLKEKPALSLLETGEVRKVLDNPLVAANEFFHAFTHDWSFAKEKAALLGGLRSQVAAGEAYCARNSARLSEIREEDHYKEWADLIMANLHVIKPGVEKIVLENFYRDQRPEEIKLKKELSAQKNAEIFYKKAKNQHIEINRLEAAIRQKEQQLAGLRDKIEILEATTDLRELRAQKSKIDPATVSKKDTGPLPYHEFYFKDFRILVGKNAQHNDTLTLRHSYKDDLWLHAKDVSGSHVLIKYQAGKNFPKDVVEYAAGLAAYNSKRKNESLCPVIVTPKKFVRKRKGDPAGAVVVEREEVVMVEPWRPVDN